MGLHPAIIHNAPLELSFLKALKGRNPLPMCAAHRIYIYNAPLGLTLTSPKGAIYDYGGRSPSALK